MRKWQISTGVREIIQVAFHLGRDGCRPEAPGGRGEGVGRGSPSKTERARFLDRRDRRAKDESERVSSLGKRAG